MKLARPARSRLNSAHELLPPEQWPRTTATRRLAAILAADVVGYSRLMGADEEGTHERLKAHLRELVDPEIREHRGRIVKTTGDGVLAEFASVVDAVRCAGEIQRAMDDRDLDLTEERRLRFRIGVNLGDVIADGDDIYGDGVNIAVRLEGLAAPGSICVSGTVRDHIGDRLPYAFDDLGRADGQEHRSGRCGSTRYGLKASLLYRRCQARCSVASSTIVSTVAAAALGVSFAWWFWPAETLFSTAGKPADPATASAASMPPIPAAASTLAALECAASVDRRAAFYQPQRRTGPAVFRGRDHRGSDD